MIDSINAEQLIDRPLFGMARDGYPGWGALALDEMRGSWARLLNDPPPSLDDNDGDD